MQLSMATSTLSYFLFLHQSFSSSCTLAFQTLELIWTLESLQSRVFLIMPTLSNPTARYIHRSFVFFCNQRTSVFLQFKHWGGMQEIGINYQLRQNLLAETSTKLSLSVSICTAEHHAAPLPYPQIICPMTLLYKHFFVWQWLIQLLCALRSQVLILQPSLFTS